MRRIVVLIFVVVLGVALSGNGAFAAFIGIGSGAISAAQRNHDAADAAGSQAVVVPHAMPRRDAEHPSSYGYRTSAQLAAAMGGAPKSASTPAPTSSGTSVTITAIVLPVRTIVVRGGHVREIWSNTSDRDPTAALYTVRQDRVTGAVVALTPAIWREARAALADADTSTGRIFHS